MGMFLKKWWNNLYLAMKIAILLGSPSPPHSERKFQGYGLFRVWKLGSASSRSARSLIGWADNQFTYRAPKTYKISEVCMVENLFLGGQTFIFHGFGAHGIFRSPNFEITLRHIDLVKVLHTVAKDLRFTRYFALTPIPFLVFHSKRHWSHCPRS